MGLKVPRILVSRFGFDDTPLSLNQYHGMQAVQVQKELMGEVAVSNLVIGFIVKMSSMTQLLSVKIVERTFKI